MKNISAFYFFYYIGLSVYSPYLSIYFSDKGIPAAAIGGILAISAITGLIAQPIMGIINDRLPDNHRILIISTMASPFIALGYYIFDSYAAFVLIACLLPILQSPSGPIGDAIALEIGQKEGFSFGSVRAWGAFGFSLGSFLTGFLYAKIGYDKSFFLYLACSAFVLLTLLRFPKIEKQKITISLSGQIKHVFFNRAFMTFMAASFLLTMAIAINFSFLPIYFKESGYDKSWIGTAYAIAAIIEVPMFWLAARLNKKIGRFLVLCAAGILYAVKCIILTLSPSLFVVLSMQLLDGICFALFTVAAVETVHSFSTAKTNATYQTVFASVTSGLGSIIGNSTGGLIIDYSNTAFLYFILFLFCSVSAVCYGVFHISSRKYSRPVEQGV